MAQDASHFTPEQILAEAHRAEAEGRFDYAIRAYRHLEEHYRGSDEAWQAEARLAELARYHGSQTRSHPDRRAPHHQEMAEAPDDPADNDMAHPDAPQPAGQPATRRYGWGRGAATLIMIIGIAFMALGAAMFAAVVGGIFPDIFEAQEKMAGGIEAVFEPRKAHLAHYQSLYEKYKKIGVFVENRLT